MQGRSVEFRVGIFVTLALVVGFALVFALGNRSSLFATRRQYHVTFSNVAGLRPGSPVRLSGIDVGTVETISFLPDGRCDVTLEVRDELSHLITLPSDEESGAGATVASLGSKGLLGDMVVDLAPWSPTDEHPRGAPVPAGGSLRALEGGGLMDALASAGDVMESARPAIENVREFTDALADEDFRRDLHGIAHNLAELSRMATEEDGTVRRLLTDRELADRLESTLGSVQIASAEIAAVSRNARAITDEIRSGDGTVHEIIYGQEGTRLVRSLADTAGEAATILRDVRTGDGNAHELLYGDSAGDLIANLTAMSADLAAITAEVRAGRGTLGALLMDPSIYEDVKRLVGNLERNEILRALVRYSIREDEAPAPAPEPIEVEAE